MKKGILLLVCLFLPVSASAELENLVRICTKSGHLLTEICTSVDTGDQYIASDNRLYEIISVEDGMAIVEERGLAELPSLEWMDADTAVPVVAIQRRIALYCTHSDECYEPTDGHYTTTGTGTIYQVAHALADALRDERTDAVVSDTLHHPHDAGAYRRSRQTAVQLIRDGVPDCLIDIHRDGIPDPASYAVTIGGKEASKIRLLVGRGNQNAALNKEFALLIKAVADRVYPGLIKDIYLGKGAFNQDLLPQSILFECGTYTLEKERILTSMPMMADVLTRALYGGVTGSAGRVTSDIGSDKIQAEGITMGQQDAVQDDTDEVGSGFAFVGGLLLVGVVGFALFSAGSFRRGMHKAGRNISEMTGGLIGKKPQKGEDPQHS